MRIGILTLPIETNYGGILQAFALQKVLRDMGHEVLTIDRHNPKRYRSLLHNFLSFGKRLKEHYVQGFDVPTTWNGFISDEAYNYISQKTQQFVKRNIRLTRWCESSDLLKIEEYYAFDAYVVGSDQIWLPNYCPDSFLPFVKREGVKKITYAASCGMRSWLDIPALIEPCKALADSFQCLSAREAFIAERATKVLGRTVEHVFDPTMLLEPKDYIAATEEMATPDSFVFTYILDASPFKTQLAEIVAQMLNLKLQCGNVSKYYTKRALSPSHIFPSVDSWLHGYNQAKFVITDSFHGTVFAIVFNKPFAVIGNKRRGYGRFVSLLKMFGLEERLVTSKEELLMAVNKPIDFDKVNKLLKRGREHSLGILCSGLNI